MSDPPNARLMYQIHENDHILYDNESLEDMRWFNKSIFHYSFFFFLPNPYTSFVLFMMESAAKD